MAKRQPLEEWITSTQAAEILTAHSDHPVSTDYVRLLGNSGKLTTKPLDKRTKLYLKSDVEGYKVKQRGTGEIQRATKTPKGKDKKEETAA